MKRTLLLSLLLCLTAPLLLASRPLAQSAVPALAGGPGASRTMPPALKGNTTPKRSTLHLASGELTPGAQEAGGVNLITAFSNTDTSGFFSSFTVGAEHLDWGIITQDTGSDVVGSFSFAYGTRAKDPSQGGPGASIGLQFYDGTQGFCADSGSTPTATFSFTGLPGTTSSGTGSAFYIIDVDLSGGFEFSHPGVGNAFGFSQVKRDDFTGSLLCYAGDGQWGPDANGQYDLFDIYETDVQSGICLGTFFYGGPPFDFSSWYLELNSVDATSSVQASATTRNTTNPNVYAPLSAPVIGGTYQATVSSSCGGGLVALGVSTGTDTFPTAVGDLLLDANSLFFVGPFPFVNGIVNISWDVGVDLSQAGLFFATQTIELGCMDPQLHNAVDLILGF